CTVLRLHLAPFIGTPPRPRVQRMLRDILLIARRPLLAAMRGGDSRTIAIHSHLDRDDPYSKAVNFFTAPLPRPTKTLRHWALARVQIRRDWPFVLVFDKFWCIPEGVFRVKGVCLLVLLSVTAFASSAVNCTYLQDPSEFQYSAQKHWREVSDRTDTVEGVLKRVVAHNA